MQVWSHRAECYCENVRRESAGGVKAQQERERVCVCVCLLACALNDIIKLYLKLRSNSIRFLDVLHLCLSTNIKGSEGIDTDKDAEGERHRVNTWTWTCEKPGFHMGTTAKCLQWRGGRCFRPVWVILSWVWSLMIKRRKFPTLDGYHSDSFMIDPVIVR